MYNQLNESPPAVKLPAEPVPPAAITDPVARLAMERFNIPYLFPYQRLVISNILEGRNQIVILPTGAGKSLCFQVPSVMLPGPTLVIFPLLSLMADQARRLEETGMTPGLLRGGQSREEHESLWERIGQGTCRFIISNPETLLAESTACRLKELHISHLVIDETHTVSEWGESFRPSYLRLGEIVEAAGKPLVTAFTATASPLILEKIRQIVFAGEAVLLVSGNPDRPNISYSVLPVLNKNHAVTLLAKSMEKPLIIFHRSRPGTEMTARLLRNRLTSDEIFFYHAALEKEEKKRLEKWFFSSKNGILCATCAYGLGVDKPDIRSVIHRDVPPSVESYLQESGRAGRDKDDSKAVLLFSEEDREAEALTEVGIQRERYRKMLEYCGSRTRCRREFLLEELGAAPEACFGCDVCAGKAASVAEGERDILLFVQKNRHRFTSRETRTILCGLMNYFCREQRLWKHRWFGRLDHWAPDDMEDAIGTLLRRGALKLPPTGLFKNRLIPG
ncbi:MAG: ATP-dependent DNA helicase RecQ [Spirochaetales bacterium]|nr:MAG: ATP-dependent DNA helicase RecQ [Spirochaetales bacterium]